MKILITAPSLDTSKNVSGISSVVNNIVKYSKYNFCHFLVGKEDNEQKGFGWVLKQFGLVYKFLVAARKCTIIHVNTALNPLSIVRDFSFVLLSKLLRKKVLLHIHGGKYLMTDCKNIMLNTIINLLIKWSNYTVVLSRFELERVKTKYRIKNINYLVNSIPIEEITYSRKHQSTDEPMCISFLGRIHESKGIEDIVEALKKLNVKNNQFIFNLYGTGPLENYIASNLSKILGKRFKFMGIVGGKAKWEALENTDIFLLPSRYGEGLPMAMLEAMAVGCVVVVTNDASIPYAVKHNVNGIIVEKRNPDDISQKLLELILDRNRIQTLSENAVQTIRSKFNIRNYVEQLELVYESIG